MQIESKTHQFATIRESLRKEGESQAESLRKKLGEPEAEFEVWPSENDDGDQTWVFARWRKSPRSAWQWLDKSLWKGARNGDDTPEPILPETLDPSQPEDHFKLFADLSEMKGLYDAVWFGDTVWTTPDGKKVVAAWLSPDDREKYKHRFNDGSVMAKRIPQPARLNDKPITFVIHAKKGGVEWPANIQWKSHDDIVLPKLTRPLPELDFGDDFKKKYIDDVKILSGTKVARFPISKRTMTFKKKSSVQPDNHLEAMADYFEERYLKIGYKRDQIERIRFVWRGIPQSIVVVKIPGSLQGKANKPVLLADHYDTAFAEDIYKRTGKRVTTPGADDNVTASAALLRAGQVLKDSKPLHDIWLVHLPGEEYPADDLGIRYFIGKLLKDKQDISGMYLMDMIGYHRKNVRSFQINAGDDHQSLIMSSISMAATKKVVADEAAAAMAEGRKPIKLKAYFRPRFDKKSYLYNTDGYVMTNNGLAVTFHNENLNRTSLGTEHPNYEANPNYHKSSDIPDNVDFDYATMISKITILSALHQANEPPASQH